jgi:transcription elongation factor Elf1
MSKEHWFAVKATFTCPKCNKTSSEVLYANASKPDPTPIALGVQRQSMSCQLCKSLLADGVQVSLSVLPVTLEQAKAAGFKPPSKVSN